ncbi:hypothetical protein QYF61_021222 [Mycteria americana]|uniref:Uncharacterized protein n=1 Tax=Mycteria americana TaxID=33587 RepID=A0AAN7PSS8_MYCAM|nr:hypothetical protein QYF61_021222 [Mycteria americana]
MVQHLFLEVFKTKLDKAMVPQIYSAEGQATLTKMALANGNCHTTHEIPPAEADNLPPTSPPLPSTKARQVWDLKRGQWRQRDRIAEHCDFKEKGQRRKGTLARGINPVSQTAPAASSQKDKTSARAAHGSSKSRDREQAAGWDTPSLRQQQAVRSVQAASWIVTLQLRSKSGLINPPSVFLHIFSSARDYHEQSENASAGGHRWEEDSGLQLSPRPTLHSSSYANERRTSDNRLAPQHGNTFCQHSVLQARQTQPLLPFSQSRLKCQDITPCPFLIT